MGNSDGQCCRVPVDSSGDKIIIQVEKKQESPESFVDLKNSNLVSKKQDKQQPQKTQEQLVFPQVSSIINNVLEVNERFTDQLSKDLPTIKLKEHWYQGRTDEQGRPDGYGKIYYSTGALFIGQFNEGVANGEGIYIWPNGSYYRGLLQNNKACDQNGFYKCESFEYSGAVNQNKIQGKGKQVGVGYTFQGTYYNNKRVQGKLVFTQKQSYKSQEQSGINEQHEGQYIYQGRFDDNNEFDGPGELRGPLGTYKGDFKNGLKDGKGIFQFNNTQLRYQGSYKNGVKEGQGTIYLKDNQIAYSGNMHNGLPQGQGWIPGPLGQRTFMKFQQGISTIYLENSIKPQGAS